jgi:hypothetical protein
MICAAVVFKNKEIILPEVGALAVGSLIYQHQAWLIKPFHIFLLPSITAIGGFLINKLDFDIATKLILVMLLIILILILFQSTLAPSLATGVLPIVTNAESVVFVYSILTLTFSLYLILRFFHKDMHLEANRRIGHKNKIIYLTIICIWILICSTNKWMFIAAIPPVIVVGYESMHKEEYTLSVYLKQILSLFIAAVIGTISLHLLNNLLLAVLVDIFLVSILVQVIKFKLPPSYAMSLLPMVLPPSTLRYFSLWVLMMSCLVLGAVFIYKNVKVNSGKLTFSFKR